MQPSSSVADNHITATGFGRCNGIKHHRRRVAALGVLNHGDAGTLAPYLQLLNGRRTEGIRRTQNHLFALPFQPGGQLADGGGFTSTIDADYQNNRGAAC